MPLPFPGYADPGLFSGAVGGAPGVPAPRADEERPDNPVSPVPPEEEQPPPEPGPFEGVDQDNAAQSTVEGGVLDATNRPFIMPGMYGGGNGPGQAVMPEGSDKLSVGGPDAQQYINEAFFEGPKRLNEAVRAGAEAQSEAGRQTAEVYRQNTKESREYEAALKEQYKLREQEMQSRLAELEKYTKSYTDNLADQGAFWHNPQNVISAIAASLMNLATDDRSLPIKMLNGAINQDLSNRRALAEGHLGQLRSNMAEYDKIAGDKIGGMQLAQAEAQRVLANEVQRIAAQFQGPIAKAKAETIANYYNIQSALGYMDFYRTRLYNRPQLVDPRILKEYQKGGQAFPDAGYMPFSQYPEAQQGAPQPTTNAARAGGYAGAMGSGGGAASVGAAAAGQAQDTEHLTPAHAAAINRRYPHGAELVEAGRAYAKNRAYLAAGVQPGTPSKLMTKAQIDKFNASMIKQGEDADKQLHDVATGLSQTSKRTAGLRMIQEDMANVEAALRDSPFAQRMGLTMDDILSSKGRVALGGGTWNKMINAYETLIRDDPDKMSKHKAAIAKLDASGRRLMQLMTGEINKYYNETMGAAVTSTELPRAEMYASTSSPYSVLKNFVNAESIRSQGEMDVQLGALGPVAKAIWLSNTGGSQHPLRGSSVNPGRRKEPKERAAPMGSDRRGPKPKEE